VTAPASQRAAPADAGPRWYSHPYNRGEFYRLAGGLGRLPRPLRLRLARGLGTFAARLLPTERAVVRKTLGKMTGATGRRLDALTLGVFREFAMCFSDLVSTNRQSVDRLAALVGSTSGADHLLGLTGGVISLTAHVGNWELAGRLLARRAARTTHVVVAEEEGRELERWVRRNGDGVHFVTRSRPTVSLTLVAALRRGEVVALQGDRALGTRGDALVPFFGDLAPFPLGPFLLAAAVGVPIVPAFCVLGADYQYRVIVMDPLHVWAGGERDALAAWVRNLEALVRERPTHWFNFFDIWARPATDS
jgi:lauroyl/myristoyl acyltransferase